MKTTTRATRRCSGRLAMRLALAGLLALGLGGLACRPAPPTGPRFMPEPPPPSGRALVYVYRIDRVSGVGAMRVRIDGGDAFELRDGEYAPLVLRSGGRRLELSLPLFGGVSRGWNSVPFTADSGRTQYLRVWAGVEEIDRGPQGRPDDFGAPGRGDRFAGVNVFASLWETRASERDIRDLQRAPGVPRSAQ
jgi:hypothetical protein